MFLDAYNVSKCYSNLCIILLYIYKVIIMFLIVLILLYVLYLLGSTLTYGTPKEPYSSMLLVVIHDPAHPNL